MHWKENGVDKVTIHQIGYYLVLSVCLTTSCSGSGAGNGKTQKDEMPPGYRGAHARQMEDAEEAGIMPISDAVHVETGLDVLVNDGTDVLNGARVGIITNHTGVAKDGRHIVDLLFSAEEVQLVAIFGPEHGVRGVEPDGKSVKSRTDSATGLPIYSLYGKTRRPTEEMVDRLDVLIFDMQDVGARFYTYIYTMALAMEAAALNGKKFIVLDRPNPITGAEVEGPMLESGFESFVGMYKIPVRHGMTVGELAMLFKGEGWIEGADSLDLKVIPMRGWRRELWFDQTDVPWISPSPSMKTLSTAKVYPGTCLIEGTNMSEGRGTDKPFEKIGAPWIKPKILANELNKLGLEGVVFEPVEFKPAALLPSVPNPKYKDQLCGGVYVRVIGRELFEPVRTGVSIIWTLSKLYPDNFDWSPTINRLYGSDRLKTGVENGISLEEILDGHSRGLEDFMILRSKYLLYD